MQFVDAFGGKGGVGRALLKILPTMGEIKPPTSAPTNAVQLAD